jgi:hypothetical protein
MGFLKYIKRLFRSRPAVQQLPLGSLTVNRDGMVVTCTVSSAYSKTLLGEIGHEVLGILHEAREAQMPLTEINIHYGSFLVTARELRGGAIIFLLPQSALTHLPT